MSMAIGRATFSRRSSSAMLGIVKRVSRTVLAPQRGPLIGLDKYNPKKHLPRLRSLNPSLLKPDVPAPYEYFRSGGRRKRNFAERVYLVLSDPDASKLSVIVSSLVMLVIFMSCVMFVIETIPDMQDYSPQCQMCKPLSGADYNNETLKEIRSSYKDMCKDCEPSPKPFFSKVEVFSITVFSVEYGIRILTCSFLPSSRERKTSPSFQWPPGIKRICLRILLFVIAPMNLVDLVAILPFYLGIVGAIPPGTKLSVVRVIRLFRIFRILRMGRLSEGVALFLGVINLSLTSFTIFLLFSAFGMVINASLVYYAESGTWDPATGEYLRPSLYYLQPNQPSPFVSIPRSFWWVLVTMTTVGYGDMYPTTGWGRVIGALSMYMGIILISMPITIMGVNLADLYQQEIKRRQRDERVHNIIGTFLHTLIVGGHVYEMRRSWNSWRYFVKDKIKEETTTEGVLGVEVASVMNRIAAEEEELHGEASKIVKDVKNEVALAKAQLLKQMLNDIQQLRNELGYIDRSTA
eukprot:c9559_g1_i1.p1 GENE.c9559_g1_i1~~c9559_g1_i1.p1  ORF type:complete len:520 (+),score=80.36 c9559_g1_i1:99-1658(+)